MPIKNTRNESRREKIMRYVTHQFAHVETLARARRWLVLTGIDPSRIEAHTHGILRLAVAVEAGESAEVQRVIDVVESSDPDGHPGFWERARQRHVDPHADAASIVGIATHSHSFVFGWHPQDADGDMTQIETGVELQKRFQEARI
jgi:hypothetical protein